MSGLLDRYDNLIIVRTFSKSRNLAGARIGFAIGNEQLIDDLKLIKYSFHPYNVSTQAQACGLEAVRDRQYFEKCTGEIRRTREYAAAELKKRGFIMTQSAANFIFASLPGISGAELYRKFRERQILVRHLNEPRIKDYLRITIGTTDQMDALIRAADEILEEI